MEAPPRTRSRLQTRADHSAFTRRVMLPGARFIRISEIAGEPLLFAALLALLWANSPWSGSYESVWTAELALRVGDFEIVKSVRDWVNDALMTIFFFVIGIEVKLEIVEGQLSRGKDAALPVVVAIGGMAVPALIFAAINMAGGTPAGWGITVATDVAFALAVVGLLGDRVPRSARVLLLAFAAADDIGGVIVIAVVYTQNIDWWAMLAAGGIFLAIFLLVRWRAVAIPYALLAVAAWICVERSGIHPTIAGVILGALVPVKARTDKAVFAERAPALMDDFLAAFRRRKEAESRAEGRSGEGQEAKRAKAAARNEAKDASDAEDSALGVLAELTDGTDKPAERMTRFFNPWASYVVLPLFALANAGIHLTPHIIKAAAVDPVAIGAAAGLVFGKPIGFIGSAWVAVKLGVARLPGGVTWPIMIALGVLAGIGFTVSLFIANLAFSGKELEPSKMGILAASAISGLAGWLAFRFWASKAKE